MKPKKPPQKNRQRDLFRVELKRIIDPGHGLVKLAKVVERIIKQVKKGSTIFSDTWRGYTGIAAKGYVHRLVTHRKDNFVTNGNHIDGLEGFWGYLKRKLAAKGGIRQSRLHLYLGEYVWRYNHRYLNLKEQENYLTKLLNKYIRYG